MSWFGRSLFVLFLYVALAVTSRIAAACTPPPNGRMVAVSAEDSAKSILKMSDAVFIGYLLSESPITVEGQFANRVARFRVASVLYGASKSALHFHESTCGSPFHSGRPVTPATEPIMLLARGDELLRAYAPQSIEADLIRGLLTKR